MKNSQRIVTIGGGKGHAALLAGLRHAGVHPTAIVNVMDNGGSSGVLMQEYDVLAPGDLRRCLAALVNDDLAALWNYRFDHGVLTQHTVGNILLVATMLQHKGSVQSAIDALAQLHTLHGEVLAVTEEHAELVATLEDGTIIRGETNIDMPKHDAALRIQQLTLEPTPHTTQRVKDALASADCVVLAPGDLYSSILPNLLVSGVIETLQKKNVPIIAIINRSTKRGETHDFSSRDFYDVYTRFLAPAKLHTLIIDDQTFPLPAGEEAVHHDAALFQDSDVNMTLADIADEHNPTAVDGTKAAKIIQTLCASL